MENFNILSEPDYGAISMAKDAFFRHHAPATKSRRLARYKTVNGRRFQLHATRGWKCIGSAEGGTS